MTEKEFQNKCETILDKYFKRMKYSDHEEWLYENFAVAIKNFHGHLDVEYKIKLDIKEFASRFHGHVILNTLYYMNNNGYGGFIAGGGSSIKAVNIEGLEKRIVYFIDKYKRLARQLRIDKIEEL